MGAWNYGVFDDDVAYDALYEFKESPDIISDMKECFDNVIESDYVEYDDGQFALVAAAVIDSVINNTDYECGEEDHLEWIKSLKGIDFSPLTKKAAAAIDAVLSDNSELKELWEENEELYFSWREEKFAIKKRLLK